jgi:hypothetical protein
MGLFHIMGLGVVAVVVVEDRETPELRETAVVRLTQPHTTL